MNRRVALVNRLSAVNHRSLSTRATSPPWTASRLGSLCELARLVNLFHPSRNSRSVRLRSAVAWVGSRWNQASTTSIRQGWKVYAPTTGAQCRQGPSDRSWPGGPSFDSSRLNRRHAARSAGGISSTATFRLRPVPDGAGRGMSMLVNLSHVVSSLCSIRARRTGPLCREKPTMTPRRTRMLR